MSSIPEPEKALAKFFNNLETSAQVGIAHSGGLDSTSLVFATIKLGFSSRIICLYADHGDRPGEEMLREKSLLQEFWRKYSIQGLILEAPLEAGLKNWEARARKLRYTLWNQAAVRNGLSAILLGHTRDDQDETLLMRFFRGRSWQGLRGIPETRGLFHRPFLCLEKKTLRKYLETHTVPWWEDSSNKGNNLRALMRSKLIPELDGLFPGWRGAMRLSAARLAVMPDFHWTRKGSIFRMEIQHWEDLGPIFQGESLLSVYQPQPGKPFPSRRAFEDLLKNLPKGKPAHPLKLALWKLEFRESSVFWGPDVVISSDFEYFLEVPPDTCVPVGDNCIKWQFLDGGPQALWLVSRLGGESWSLPRGYPSFEAELKRLFPDPVIRKRCFYLVEKQTVWGILGRLAGGGDWTFSQKGKPLWQWENDERFSEQ